MAVIVTPQTPEELLAAAPHLAGATIQRDGRRATLTAVSHSEGWHLDREGKPAHAFSVGVRIQRAGRGREDFLSVEDFAGWEILEVLA